MHPRNRLAGGYNFSKLVRGTPELGSFVKYDTIDFANPKAVQALNRALLKTFYGISKWDLPEGALTPAVPGRADYIHHLADLLARNNTGKIPRGRTVRLLDVGVGANCIFPIIGMGEYGWSFLGSDVTAQSIESAKSIVSKNPKLKPLVKLRLQSKADHIFKGIIKPGELFEATLCNPPFHASLEEAHEEARTKWSNLGRVTPSLLNFSGQGQELWCPGGEESFLKRLITESSQFSKSCLWFTSMVSKKAYLSSAYSTLTKVNALEVREIPTEQGQKKGRILAWTFQNKDERAKWKEKRFLGH